MEFKSIALDNLGSYDEPVAVYDKILSMRPDYGTRLAVLQAKALALLNFGSNEEAITVSDKVISIEPNMIHANITKDNALLNLGRYDEASKTSFTTTTCFS